MGLFFRRAAPPSSLHHHLEEKQHNAMILIDETIPRLQRDLCVLDAFQLSHPSRKRALLSLVPNTHWFHSGSAQIKISFFLQTDPHWLAGWFFFSFAFEGMMSCVWPPSKRVREALLGSLRCHSPVQCCLNMIRQGSTVKRLKA